MNLIQNEKVSLKVELTYYTRLQTPDSKISGSKLLIPGRIQSGMCEQIHLLECLITKPLNHANHSRADFESEDPKGF